MLHRLWVFLFGPRATAAELSELRDQLDALGRQLADLPTLDELARQKAAWAGFRADYLDLADRLERNLKKLGARMSRSGQTWDGEEVESPQLTLEPKPEWTKYRRGAS